MQKESERQEPNSKRGEQADRLEQVKQLTLALMDALQTRGLGEVQLEADNVKIKIKAKDTPVVQPVIQPVTTVATTSPSPLGSAAAAGAVAAPEEVSAEPTAGTTEEETGTPVKSPLVGTFYSAPSPEAPPFVLVGQHVSKGDILFIIEAMKTMNEIKSPCDGTVARILALPGDMVEYNQTVVVIDEDA